MANQIEVVLVGRDRHLQNEVIQQTLSSLENKNKHERDSHVTFEEEGHKYFIDGSQNKYSCTGLVAKQFAPFDKNAAIEAIIKSRGYLGGKGYYSGMSPAEIMSDWDKRRDLGTEMHAIIEFIINSSIDNSLDMFDIKTDNVAKEISIFKKFYNTYVVQPDMPLVPFRTEWIIYDKSFNITGSVDAIFKSYGPLPEDPNMKVVSLANSDKDPEFEYGEERFWIVDWKRSKDMKTKYSGNYKSPDKMCYIRNSGLENCDFSRYSLQLNVYRTILEYNYNMRIAGMILVSIHPSKDEYSTYKVPFLTKSVDKMLRQLLKE